VLIRALEPVEGVAAMRAARLARAHGLARTAEARGRADSRLALLPAARLASGPGLLAAAFDVTRADTGLDLLAAESPLRLEAGDAPARITQTPRVGIGYAAEPWRSEPWRFIDPDSPSVSAR
jgi:DNA-3-methyladenine glycosylase